MSAHNIRTSDLLSSILALSAGRPVDFITSRRHENSPGPVSRRGGTGRVRAQEARHASRMCRAPPRTPVTVQPGRHRRGHRQLVRPSVPRPRGRQWRNLRHGEDDGRPPHPAVQYLGAGSTIWTTARTTEVRIIDRGPFVGGRIIDLSHAAARELAMIGPGTAQRRIEVISAPPGVPPASSRSRWAPSATVPTPSACAAEWRRATARPACCSAPRIPAFGVYWWAGTSEDDANRLAERIRQDSVEKTRRLRRTY